MRLIYISRAWDGIISSYLTCYPSYDPSSSFAGFTSHMPHPVAPFPCAPLLHAFNPFHRVNKMQISLTFAFSSFFALAGVCWDQSPLALRAVATGSMADFLVIHEEMP